MVVRIILAYVLGIITAFIAVVQIGHAHSKRTITHEIEVPDEYKEKLLEVIKEIEEKSDETDRR